MCYNNVMKKIELLAPAGNIESAYAAIQNGGDAIYISGYKFGARAYANNFSLEEIESIVAYAHSYHVRVYVTLNTLVYDHELEECFAYIYELYKSNVDALIVQDLGVLYYLRTHYPDFEVHASTQMHIYNKDALLFLSSQGVSRAVLARECSKEQIASFKDVQIEKEMFVHGALCIAFSGQCLFSAMNNSRSGNRGMCAQGCRMPYTLYKEDQVIVKDKYLLSPKDLNLLDDKKELLKLQVDSLKIEGRMKSSEYVGNVTSLYRKLLDTNDKIDENDMECLKVLFNRDYTKGHLFSQQAKQLMNYERPNHMGVELGKVVYVNKHKIGIHLKKALHQQDGIRFILNKDIGFQVNRLYQNGLLVASVKANEIVELDRKDMPIKVGCKVVKTKDVQMEKELQLVTQKQPRKEYIYGSITVKVNEPIHLKVWDMYNNKISVLGNLVNKAQKHSAQVEDIRTKLMKTGDTIYKFKHFDVILDENCFVPVKELNELRREALTKLNKLVQASFMRKHIELHLPKVTSLHTQETCLEVTLTNEEQLQVALTFPNIHIYVNDLQLYRTYKQYEQVYYRSIISETYPKETTMVADIGGIHKGYYLDASLNIHNAYALEYMNHFHNKHIYLSQELTYEDIKELLKAYQKRNATPTNVGVILYGKSRLMSMKYCVVNSICKDGKKQNCTLCKQHSYYLQDIKNKKFWLHGDAQCYMHLYHHEASDQIHLRKEYEKLKITIFRLDFTNESPQIMKNIIQKFQNSNQ